MLRLEGTWTTKKPRGPWWPTAVGAVIIIVIILVVTNRNPGCGC